METRSKWIEIADELLKRAGGRSEALVMARALGLYPRPRTDPPARAAIRGQGVYYDAEAGDLELEAAIYRALARWALNRAGLRATAAAVSVVAARLAGDFWSGEG